MEIPITTLQQMLTNAATLGAMSAVKKLDPVKDELKASEVRVWLGNDSKMSRKFDAMVRKGMINALIPYYIEGDTIHAKNIVADVYRAIRRDDLDEALQTLKAYLASVPYAENANSEGHYQTMLYVVFSLLGRYVQQEVRTAKGRIDMVLTTATDIYVIELKIDRPAQEALEQIDTKDYLLPYTLDGRHLHKVGISFSTESRTIEEWKTDES